MPADCSETRLAIVCPMANESETAISFVQQVFEQTAQLAAVRMFVVLDRVSTDGTLALMREYAHQEPRLRVIWAPENRCVVDAYIAGYRAALATGYEWILEIDAGFSHQPSDLPKFIEAMGPDVQCVFGSRFAKGGQVTDTPWTRRFLSRGGTALTNLLLGTRLSDMTSGYELFRRDVLARILEHGIESRAHFFQTEIKYYCRKMKCVEVPIAYQATAEGVAAASVRDALRHLLRLFRKRLVTGFAPRGVPS